MYKKTDKDDNNQAGVGLHKDWIIINSNNDTDKSSDFNDFIKDFETANIFNITKQRILLSKYFSTNSIEIPPKFDKNRITDNLLTRIYLSHLTLSEHSTSKKMKNKLNYLEYTFKSLKKIKSLNIDDHLTRSAIAINDIKMTLSKYTYTFTKSAGIKNLYSFISDCEKNRANNKTILFSNELKNLITLLFQRRLRTNYEKRPYENEPNKPTNLIYTAIENHVINTITATTKKNKFKFFENQIQDLKITPESHFEDLRNELKEKLKLDGILNIYYETRENFKKIITQYIATNNQLDNCLKIEQKNYGGLLLKTMAKMALKYTKDPGISKDLFEKLVTEINKIPFAKSAISTHRHSEIFEEEKNKFLQSEEKVSTNIKFDR